ncbi:MAG: hypothetical protein ACTHK7_21315, partial [Aureliella sp.]
DHLFGSVAMMSLTDGVASQFWLLGPKARDSLAQPGGLGYRGREAIPARWAGLRDYGPLVLETRITLAQLP